MSIINSSLLVDRILLNERTPVNVLFDECHGESWSISEDVARRINPDNLDNCSYHSLARILAENGYSLHRLSDSPITSEKLRLTDVFVVVHPCDGKVCKNTIGDSYFTEQEIDIVESWVRNGGNLFVLYEYEAKKMGKQY